MVIDGHRVGPERRREFEALLAVLRLDDLVAGAAQERADADSDEVLILDDEDSGLTHNVLRLVAMRRGGPEYVASPRPQSTPMRDRVMLFTDQLRAKTQSSLVINTLYGSST